MSKHKHHASQRGDPNAPTTAPTEPSTPPATQEKTMEASQDQTTVLPPEQIGLTTKQMAAAEEINAARSIALAQQQEKPAEEIPTTTLADAAKGYDALHEAFRQHNEKTKAAHKEYTPPPRTARQMSALEEELQAGARSVARAEAQRAASRPEPVDGNKEGFMTPVFRPNDSVPDPTTGKLGLFSPDV